MNTLVPTQSSPYGVPMYGLVSGVLVEELISLLIQLLALFSYFVHVVAGLRDASPPPPFTG